MTGLLISKGLEVGLQFCMVLGVYLGHVVVHPGAVLFFSAYQFLREVIS